ncbi:MAG: hypothetical protein GX425_07435 [Peptococcaceae bacterium]|nr:hypothetical protein [Peptococcaceae bacterium]
MLVRLYHNQGGEKKKQQLIDMLESFSENMGDLKLHFEMAYMYLDIEEIDKVWSLFIPIPNTSRRI